MLNPSAVVTARQRLADYMSQFWPDIDTRPNSVFGDLHLTPLALLITSLETAMDSFRSDLNLANVAQGVVFDSDFVTAYLASFGVTASNAVSASGIIKMTFSADGPYSFSLDTPFTFGSSIFKIAREVLNPVVINNTQAQGAAIKLANVAPGQYVVLLPVAGPAGSAVNSGDSATTTLTMPALISVTASGDFNSGSMPDSIPAMAVRAQRTFASANLTSRTGTISFVVLKFPQILGVAATITGDAEMIRAGLNPLGLAEGAIDVFVKSSTNWISNIATLPLVYDYNQQVWLGQLKLPAIPAFYDLASGVFQVGNFLNSRGASQVYSKSKHAYIDNVGVSYSRHEVLGIKITDTQPLDFTPSFLSDVKALVSDGTVLEVQGEYISDIFNANPGRNITMRMDTLTTYNGMPAVKANLLDTSSGETGSVFFTNDNDASPTSGILAQGSGDYQRMINGLTMRLISVSGSFSLSGVIGFTYQFSFQGRSSNFDFNYYYDPAVVLVDATVQNPDNKPVNVSVLTRSFLVCYISTFVVNYRIPYGATVNEESARAGISDYINSIVYPQAYEESTIGYIMTVAGGASLMRINKRGTFYPSLASIFVDKSGNQSPIPQLITTDLVPPVNDSGVGPRNVTFFLDPNTIVFNATIV